MIVVNFAHPLTEAQRAQIEALTGRKVERVVDVPTQVNEDVPLEHEVADLVDGAGLTAEEWQREAILVNPPGYAPAAVVLMAELHGRMGHFPTVLRMRPVAGSASPVYEVAEVMNLQAVRKRARKRGWEGAKP